MKYPLKKQMKRLAGSLPRQRKAGEEYEKILSKADADASKKLEDAKKMIDLERRKGIK